MGVFFDMITQLMDIRLAEFKKEPVNDATDIKDDYGPGPITQRRLSRPISLGSSTERRMLRKGLSKAETIKSPLLTRIDSVDSIMDEDSDSSFEFKCALNADDFVVKDAPPKIRYVPNFLNEEEEELLMRRIYEAPTPKWDYLKNRRLQNWGGLVGKKGLIPDGPLPDWLNTLIDRIMEVENGFSIQHRPNHVLINEYTPGQGIMPHTDGPAFYPLISTISLGGSTMLDFYTPLIEDGSNADLNERYVGSMWLQPRSLILINEDAYSFLHGIKECKTDIVTEKTFNRPNDIKVGTEVPRDTRVSLTIRHVEHVSKLSIGKLLNRT